MVVIIVLLILTVVLIKKRRNSKSLASPPHHDHSHSPATSNFIHNDPKEANGTSVITKEDKNKRNESHLLPLSEVESANPVSVTKHVRRPPPIPPSLRNEFFHHPSTNEPTPSEPPSVNSHVHSHNGISSSEMESLQPKKPIPGIYITNDILLGRCSVCIHNYNYTNYKKLQPIIGMYLSSNTASYTVHLAYIVLIIMMCH